MSKYRASKIFSFSSSDCRSDHTAAFLVRMMVRFCLQDVEAAVVHDRISQVKEWGIIIMIFSID